MELHDRQRTWQGFSDALAMAFEFVATPMLLALLGFWLDGRFGTRPVLAFVLGLTGFAGMCLRTYYWYQADIKREEEGKPWTRSRR